MNIPNKKRVNMISEPLNFHLEKTYPLSEPSTVEPMVAHIVRIMELMKFGLSMSAAVEKLDQLIVVGNSQAEGKLMSAGSLRAVTTAIYAGIRNKIARIVSVP
jgi:hypothetical protein